MFKSILSVLILLLFCNTANANLYLQGLKTGLSALKLLNDELSSLQEGLDDVKKIQIAEIVGDSNGVIKTVEDFIYFKDKSKMKELANSGLLVQLNQSLEKSFLLAKILSQKDYKVSDWNILNFSYSSKTSKSYSEVWVAFDVASVYQHLSITKVGLLKYISESDAAEAFQKDYYKKINILRKNLSGVVNGLLNVTTTRLYGHKNIPYSNEDFCSKPEIKYIFSERLKGFSFSWEKIIDDSDVLETYSKLYCVLTMISINKDSDEKYVDGPFASKDILYYLQLFSVDQLDDFYNYQSILENNYVEDASILRSNFRQIISSIENSSSLPNIQNLDIKETIISLNQKKNEPETIPDNSQTEKDEKSTNWLLRIIIFGFIGFAFWFFIRRLKQKRN